MSAKEPSNNEAVQALNPRKIILPMLVSLGAVVYLFASNDDLKWDDIVRNVQNANPWGLVLALVALLARDAGYMYRIRELTSKQLSWMSSFYVVILWEFSSAITPSVVGGTAVAIFILNREGLSFGKSIAYAWLTAVLDNLFFVFASLFVIIFLPESFPNLKMGMIGSDTEVPVRFIFIVSAALIFIHTSIMGLGLFLAPRYIKLLLVRLTSLSFLRRWRHGAIESGNEMIIASKELQGMTFKYWVKAILSTIFIWSARYLIVNFLIMSFFNLNLNDHLLVFGRHVIMWIAMLISITPGGSGLAEYFFPKFFGDFAGNFSLAVGVFWRLLTYYGYLLLGAIFLPRWLSRVWPKKTTAKETSAGEEKNKEEK